MTATGAAFAFPSPEWVSACGVAINASRAYREASADWTYGAVALIVRPQPDLGIAEPLGIWLDLDRGQCRAARIATAAEADAAPFVISADYAAWKAVLQRELGPIAGILRGKLLLRGSLAVVVRHVSSAEALVEAATTVPTRFLDEA